MSKKTKDIRTAIVLACVALAFFVLFISQNISQKHSVERRLIVNGKPMVLEIVTSVEDVTQGLGDRDSMPKEHGMLFVFGKPDRYTFWMRHMRFPLDIIWIRDGNIVEMAPAMQPPKDGDVIPETHIPSVTADQVLELNAGSADAYGLKIGDMIRTY